MEGRFNGGFFGVTSLRGLYLEGLIYGGAYFRNFTVFLFSLVPVHFPLMQFIIIYFLLESHEGMIKYKKGKKISLAQHSKSTKS